MKNQQENNNIESGFATADKSKGAGYAPVLLSIMQSHINMNSQIDRKCSLLFSLNSAILAIGVGTLIPQLGERPNLILPTIILLVFSMCSLLMAFFASKNYFSKKRSKREQDPNDNNLLLFGNMKTAKIEEFKFGLLETLEDKEYLFSSLAENVFHLKAGFKNKNAYINWAYNFLIIGILLAVPIFVLVLIVL